MPDHEGKATGFFFATRVPLSFNLDGTSVAAPPTLTLPPSGWMFAGVTPFDNDGSIVTSFLWSDTQVVWDGDVLLSDISTPTLAATSSVMCACVPSACPSWPRPPKRSRQSEEIDR